MSVLKRALRERLSDQSSQEADDVSGAIDLLKRAQKAAKRNDKGAAKGYFRAAFRKIPRSLLGKVGRQRDQVSFGLKPGSNRPGTLIAEQIGIIIGKIGG